jgi:hypothetical protein
MPAIPVGIATVVLTGRYIRPDGTPLLGTLTFEPPSHLTIPGSDTISAGSASVTLDESGAFSVALIATDDPGTQPSDWTYQVVERLAHATGRTFAIKLPAVTPLVDLADIAPTDPDQGDYVVVTGPAGKDGSQIYTGVGAPPGTTGANADFYVDTTVGAVTLYGPKAGGTWPSTGVVLGNVSSVNGQMGAVVLPGVTDGVNVKTIGAKVDGTTDDTAVIQGALNAAPRGGRVYLPAGVVRTSAPLRVPPEVTLMGAHGSGEVQPGAPAPATAIKPLPGFTGSAVIEIVDQQMGGYSGLSGWQRIERLTIDGSAVPVGTAVDGIRMTGQIQNPIIRDVAIRNVTGVGVNTAYNLSVPSGPQAPFCLNLDRVSVVWGKSHGLALNNSTDSTFINVYVLGCSGFGWYIAGCSGTTWIACRAEWSTLDGFNLAGNSGVQTFIGCSTDRSGQNGFSVPSSTNTGTIVLSGCRMTRDGKSSTSAGYAGLNVSGTTRKVIADGVVITTGRDDDGTSGNLSPQYGVSATNSSYVSVASGDINGVSSGWRDGGGNTVFQRGTTVTGTGITTSLPRIDQLQAPTANVPWGGVKLTNLANGTATNDAAAFGQIPVAGTTAGTYAAGNDSRITGALQTSGGTMAGTVGSALAGAANVAYSALVTGDAFDRFRSYSDGKLEWGPGNVTRDTNLYRSAAGALKTDSFFLMGGSGQANGQITVFTATAKGLVAGTAGGGLAIKEGTNARLGVSTLSAGTVTVANTSVTSTTRIFLQRVSGAAANFGHLTYTINAGVSFTVTSSNASDTSVFNWHLVEPA